MKGHPAIQYLQYLLARAFISLLLLIPARLAFLFPRILGFLLYHLIPKRKQVGRENLERALGQELSAQEREIILRKVYTNLARTLVEVLYYPRILTAQRWEKYVTLEGRDILEGLKEKGKGIVFIGCHLGNWEILGSMAKNVGFQVHPLARPLDNLYLNEYLEKHRERNGMNIISKRGALRIAAKVLKEEKHLAFLIDQDARDHGIFVDFFGRKASTHPGFALLAIRERCPVVPTFLLRERGFFRFRMIIGEPIWPNPNASRDEEMLNLTQKATARLEERIRQAPDQWLWIHKRWKTSPKERGNAGPTSQKEVVHSDGT